MVSLWWKGNLLKHQKVWKYYESGCSLIKYNWRTQSDFLRNSVNSSKCGLDSIRFFASKVWEVVPMEIRNLKSHLKILETKLEDGNLVDVTVNSAKTLC